MDLVSFARMSNVLEQTKQQQVLALGQLGWPASRIAAAVQVDRATVTGYLRAAGLRGARPGAAERRGGKCRNFTGGVHRPPGKSRNFAARGVHRLDAVTRPAEQCLRAAS